MVDTFEVIAPGTVVTADGHTSPGIPVQEGTMLELEVLVTAVSAVTAVSLWLETCSQDGESDWFEFPADEICKGRAGGTGPVESTQSRTNAPNIINSEAITAPLKWKAVYKHFPAGKFRLSWDFAGTSITWGVRASIK